MTSSPLDDFIISTYQLLQDYPRRGRYFHEFSSKDNSPVVVHSHTNQLTYVIRGTGKVILDGREQELHEGSTIFVPAGTQHCFLTESSMILFHIHIPDEGRENDREVLEGNDYERFVSK